jgi:hypothetical protein
MSLRSRLARLERAHGTPGGCPECGVPPDAVRAIVIHMPKEPGEPYVAPYLEGENGTPYFCETCGRRFPMPFVRVQRGDEDSQLLAKLIGRRGHEKRTRQPRVGRPG